MIIISGYFLAHPRKHKGYQQYFSAAVQLAANDTLLIIVNNEAQQCLKYGKVIVKPVKIKRRLQRYFLWHYKLKPAILISASTDRTIIKDLNIKLFKDGDYDDNNQPPEAAVCTIVYGNNPKIASSSKILGL